MLEKIPKSIYFSSTIFIFLSLADFSYATNIRQGIDHAPISEHHIQDRKQFINNNFKESGAYSVNKILFFLARMQKELTSIKNDAIETQIIESVELDIKKPKRIKKKLRLKFEKNSNKLVIPYERYLIPKIEQLLQHAKNVPCTRICDGIVDDFIRGYYSYYIPNSYRNVFPLDLNISYVTKRLFIPFRIKKNDNNAIEANNLIVDRNQKKAINSCLSKKVKKGHYLLQKELEELKSCRFDISTLDPGLSPFWKKLNKEQENIHYIPEELFPKENEQITFQRFIYRGQGSPKVKAFFIRNGIKQSLKIKVGREIRTDKAVSRFGEIIGLNQDKMLYQPYIKLNLGKFSFTEFKSLIINKYGSDSAIRFIWGYGGEPGEEWVLLKDALFEGRPKDELRLSTFDIGSWDFQNRREYRSILLFWAWLGVNDTKLANFKALFKKDIQGNWYPLLRLQDTGIGLGSEFNLRKFKNLLNIKEYYKVNIFPTSFLKETKNKKEVKIHWNDFANRKRHFKSTTWNDLKWMARQILSIKEQDIHKTLKDSGMPEEVVDIYAIKLKKRRNEIADIFELGKEYKKFSTPDLRKYSPEHLPGIKKGKVIKKVFKDKNDVVHVQEKWLTYIPKVLQLDIPTNFWSNEDSDPVHFQQSIQPPTGVKHSACLNPGQNGKPFFKIPLGLGVQAIISREVRTNSQLININNKNHLYRVTDHLRIKIGADSPFLKKLIKSSKLSNGTAHIRIFQKDYYHVQFSDSVKGGYYKKFKLLQIIKNVKSYAEKELKLMEVIKSETSFGFDFGIGAGVYPIKPVLKNEIDLGITLKKTTTINYLKDQYGKLHITRDQLKERGDLFHLNLFEANLFQAKFPLFKIMSKNKSYHYQFSDSFYENNNQMRDRTKTLSSDSPGKKEKLPNHTTTGYHLEAKGKTNHLGIGAGFLFNLEKEKELFEITTKYDNKTSKFIRVRQRKMKNTGIEKLTIDYGQSDILVKSRKRTEITSEIDLINPKKYLIIIRTEDFYRKRTLRHLKLLIQDLNRRYSINTKKLFYREYFLPPKKEVHNYRKIYALTRIYMDGNKLLKKIKRATLFEIQELLDKHLQTTKKKSRLKTYITSRLRKKIIRLVHEIKKSKKIKKQVESLNQFVNKTKTELFGVEFYKKFIGKKNLFIMGEIAGILRSYSALQTLQQQQIRRFAAHSWGKLNKKSPIQKHLRYQRYARPSVFITKQLADNTIFGPLEVGVATNIQSIFDKNRRF